MAAMGAKAAKHMDAVKSARGEERDNAGARQDKRTAVAKRKIRTGNQ